MRYISDTEIAESFAPFNFGEKQSDNEWRRKTVATQLLKLTAGYSISYSQKQVLASLKLLKADSKPNATGREFMCTTLIQREYS